MARYAGYHANLLFTISILSRAVFSIRGSHPPSACEGEREGLRKSGMDGTEELDKGRLNGCLLIKSSSEITYDSDEDVIETRRWHILINVVWLVLFIYLFQHLSREFCQGNPNPLQSPHRRDCMNILIFYSVVFNGLWLESDSRR